MAVRFKSIICFGFQAPADIYDELANITDHKKLIPSDTDGGMVIDSDSCYEFTQQHSILDPHEINSKKVLLKEVQKHISNTSFERLTVTYTNMHVLIDLMKRYNLDKDGLKLWFIEYVEPRENKKNIRLMNHKLMIETE